MPIPADWSEKLRAYVSRWKAADSSEREEYLGDRPFENFVLTDHARCWEDVAQWINEFDSRWCFRGQREVSWSLDTSLDRAVRVEYSGRDHSGYYHLDRDSEQSELLLRFQQQAQHHVSHLPATDDFGSWLALMQHHGVPTRLLDWTASSYVALYFAEVEQANEIASAVWALDRDWLLCKARELLGSSDAPVASDPKSLAENTNRLLRHTEKPIIIQVEPLRMSQRMATQQGLLLCKLFHQTTFSSILVSMMIHPDVPERPVLRKLAVDRELRIECLRRLREMNIHDASLFPGIDGFGRSLKLDLEIKVQSLAARHAG